MNLVIDIGNSNIVLSVYQNGEWSHTLRYETKGVRQEIYYEVSLRQILMEWGIHPDTIKYAVISSVVPDLNNLVLVAVKAVVGCPVLLLGPDVYKILDLKIPHPYEIGSDLVANAYAGLKKYGDKVIIVDFGTALSFVVANKKEGIIGVTIAPGLKTAAQSLVDQTAQLPLIPLEYPNSVIGKDTQTAIQAGIMFGYTGLCKEICRQMKNELGDGYKVVLTGGHSVLVSHIQKEADYVDKMLTLDGMRWIGDFVFERHFDYFV